ncbi:hypothetical protein GALMADRAFT_272014 [Galerina marginata CBS 339.88]|uniref:GST N-terminal domain-containing protein n=1 Tax=Galerina marginata (strain CBS 339.88) TaxID=685588 RepID=A0A067SHD6_GALM3|nr:hypothetical protein GALMADRAFT_272014 [Galerina marginata CBS 339.88]
MSIILYDIPSQVAVNAWSPNIWKTRYALNYKGLAYKTEWVEFNDIEAHAKKHGIAPTSTNPDFYSLPAIYDAPNKTYVAGAIEIAEYLDEKYPNTPRLFPHNTLGLQTAFTDVFLTKLGNLWQFIVPAVNKSLNPPSAAYFRRTREALFGVTLEELLPKGDKAVTEWAKVQAGFNEAAVLFAKNGGKGPFAMGETISYADVNAGAYLIWLRTIWGENSQQWKDISSWSGGRWGALLKGLAKYETIV